MQGKVVLSADFPYSNGDPSVCHTRGRLRADKLTVTPLGHRRAHRAHENMAVGSSTAVGTWPPVFLSVLPSSDRRCPDVTAARPPLPAAPTRLFPGPGEKQPPCCPPGGSWRKTLNRGEGLGFEHRLTMQCGFAKWIHNTHEHCL